MVQAASDRVPAIPRAAIRVMYPFNTCLIHPILKILSRANPVSVEVKIGIDSAYRSTSEIYFCSPGLSSLLEEKPHPPERGSLVARLSYQFLHILLDCSPPQSGWLAQHSSRNDLVSSSVCCGPFRNLIPSSSIFFTWPGLLHPGLSLKKGETSRSLLMLEAP